MFSRAAGLQLLGKKGTHRRADYLQMEQACAMAPANTISTLCFTILLFSVSMHAEIL